MAPPIIESFEFGRIVISNQIYKDIVIYNNAVAEWKWHEHHAFTMEDIMPLVKGTDVLVLGTGASGYVKVKDDVLAFLESNNVRHVIAKSDKACQKYNELVKAGKNVAAIIHSTC